MPRGYDSVQRVDVSQTVHLKYMIYQSMLQYVLTVYSHAPRLLGLEV